MSKLFRLHWNDLIKGCVVAVVAGVLGLILTALQNQGHIDWRMVLNATLISAISYIIKQLGTDHNGKLMGKINVGNK